MGGHGGSLPRPRGSHLPPGPAAAVPAGQIGPSAIRHRGLQSAPSKKPKRLEVTGTYWIEENLLEPTGTYCVPTDFEDLRGVNTSSSCDSVPWSSILVIPKTKNDGDYVSEASRDDLFPLQI